MIYKILVTLLLISMKSYASDYIDHLDERGMTKLLGPETYFRCSKFLADPKAKTYELSYKRTSTMPL
jgi:hypothetical protein